MRSPFLYAEVLTKTIEELWYGNISPFEQCTRNTRLKELLKLVARNREELDGMLTDKQKETLEKFKEYMNEMHSIPERDAISSGFRLGVQLMSESFQYPFTEEISSRHKSWREQNIKNRTEYHPLQQFSHFVGCLHTCISMQRSTDALKNLVVGFST